MVHNTSHFVLPVVIFLILITFIGDIEPSTVFIIVMTGALAPDLDHLQVWREYKFKSFWSFIKFHLSAKRYRYSFLVFHNFLALLSVAILMIVVGRINRYVDIFFVSFFSHLLLDFFYDASTMKRFSHWKFGRRI